MAWADFGNGEWEPGPQLYCVRRGLHTQNEVLFPIISPTHTHAHTHTHTHTSLMALWLGLPGWAGTRKVKPIWILLKQETMSGSSISWAICKSAPCSRQTTTPAPHHSVFYRSDALPAAKPTSSKHWRQSHNLIKNSIFSMIWLQLSDIIDRWEFCS